VVRDREVSVNEARSFLRSPPRMTPGSSGPGLLCCLALLLAPALVAGCGGADDRPARWAFIAPAIIEPNCATVSCHSTITDRAGVILEPRAVAYHTLVDRHFVIPGAPELSEVVALMRAQGSQRMPPDFAMPEVDIALIERWIANGAHDD
jgi:hypothetical protein